MNKTGWFLGWFLAWALGFSLLSAVHHQMPVQPPVIPPVIPIKPVTPPVEPDCVGVQVPIAASCRVPNKSGSQCVWCSIEALCRHHGIKEVYEGDNRITKYHTWATGPGNVAHVMWTEYPTVKWKQIQDRNQLKAFCKKYVTEKKLGIGLAVPGHMLNLVHYDEAAGIVKVIDNQGPKALQIQEWTMDKFNRLYDGWAIVVFPKNYVDTAAFDCSLSEPNKIYGLNN